MDFIGPRQTGMGWCAGRVNTVGTGLGIVQPSGEGTPGLCDPTVRSMANIPAQSSVVYDGRRP